MLWTNAAFNKKRGFFSAEATFRIHFADAIKKERYQGLE
jgi:hypothetical protein